MLEAGADLVHFDVMDHYVPNLTVGPLVCQALREFGIAAPIDVHLMVRPVDRIVPDFAAAGATYITFHPDATKHVNRTIVLIREHGCRPGLVLSRHPARLSRLHPRAHRHGAHHVGESGLRGAGVHPDEVAGDPTSRRISWNPVSYSAKIYRPTSTGCSRPTRDSAGATKLSFSTVKAVSGLVARSGSHVRLRAKPSVSGNDPFVAEFNRSAWRTNSDLVPNTL